MYFGEITDDVRRGSFLHAIEQAEAQGRDQSLERGLYELRNAVEQAGYPAWGVNPDGTPAFHVTWIGLGAGNAIEPTSFVEGYEDPETAEAAKKWRNCLRYLENTEMDPPGWICTATTRREPEGIWRLASDGTAARTQLGADARPPALVVPGDTAAAQSAGPVPWGTMAIVGGSVALLLALAWRIR